jgi:hypothetical protein
MAAKYTDAAAARNHGAAPTIRDKVLIAAMTRACGNMYRVAVFANADRARLYDAWL